MRIYAMARIMITEAHSVGNLTIEMKFNDNTIQCVNIGDFIHAHPHPQYDKYMGEHEFQKFTIDDGNIVWGEDWNPVFPVEQLYAGAIA